MARSIRRLISDDYDDIIQLWSDAGLPYKPLGRDSRQRLTAEMALDFCAFYGLFEDRRMLAMGIANFDGRRGWVNRVAVHPDFRGMNLAGEIIRECEEFLTKQGALVICALIEDVNYPSISCFQNQGYECLQSILYYSKRESDDV
jgi:ribosomal protein S18 acetylase RimI-like enzyme